jgi:hypothetical protein
MAEPDREKDEATMASKSLYVGNLSYSGFVDVPEDKAAPAIAAMNGREVDGRAINVSEARPKRERSDRGGDRRGGGFGR